MKKIIQHTLPVGPFQCNCQIIVCPQTFQAAIIDPGDESQKIISEIAKIEAELSSKITVTHIFHTHGHLDHIGGTRGVCEHLIKLQSVEAVRWLHLGDEELYLMLQEQGKMFGFQYQSPLAIQKYFDHEQEIEVGHLKLKVIHTPGHSPGSVSLWFKEDSSLGMPETVFTGDTLFKRSVGRTDLWGASAESMFKSIRERLLTLDGDTLVWPGHGPATKIGLEKHENPFLR